jgi:uncharacterized protein
MLRADGTTERVLVGPDLRSGQRVQLLIPGNTFIRRVSSDSAIGFWVQAANGRGWSHPTSKSAMSIALAEKYPDTANDLRASNNVGATDLNRLQAPGLRGKCRARPPGAPN